MRRAGAPTCLRVDARTGARRPGFPPANAHGADGIDALLADKGYDAGAIREELADAKIEAALPAKVNRRNPASHDPAKYHWRNRIEPLFDKLKN